ncbi:MAG: M56 family metallopeptidase [Bacillota bacterium]
MTSVFLKVLSMTAVGTLVALFVMLVRPLLRKAPKVFSYVLWLVVLFRLICPLSIESNLSIVPVPQVTDKIHSVVTQSADPSNLPVQDGIQIVEPVSPEPGNAVEYEAPSEPSSPPESSGATIWHGLSRVWLVGATAVLGYGIYSYFRLKRSLTFATLVEGNIYEADTISSPFVLGLLSPKIYIPVTVQGEEREYVLKHEEYHIKRMDHIVKALYFLALAIHWFNPIVWISFSLMTKDMEMSCDEMVLSRWGKDIRADYSTCLLNMSINQRFASPLAFGENNTKSRIKNVAGYRKPSSWLMIISLLVVVSVIIVLAVNPKKPISYENSELGFSLEFPSEWEERYVVEEHEDSVVIYCKKVYDEWEHEGGRLLTIQRQIGELIDEEDIAQSPAPAKMLLQGNGYTYYATFASDVQYPPDNSELAKEYLSLEEQLDLVCKSIALLGDTQPVAKNEGFKVLGTAFFKLEVPEDWDLKRAQDHPVAWDIWVDEINIGQIKMIPYNTEVIVENGSIDDYNIARFADEYQRQAALIVHRDYADDAIMEKIKDTFEWTDGYFTVIDLMSNANIYVERGGTRLFGKIENVTIEDSGPISVEVTLSERIADDQSPSGYRFEDLNETKTLTADWIPNIVPLAPPDYTTYGRYDIYLLDTTFIEAHPDYKDFYYEFILDSGGNLTILFQVAD